MARDGSGNYSLPSGQPVVTGTTISSTVHNTFASDVASALTASLAKDGQTTPTANLPMGGFKHTGVAEGTARNHYAAISQVQDQSTQYLDAVSGTNTITANLIPAIAAYVTGLRVVLNAVNANTGAVTLALNGLSAKSVVDAAGNALIGGELRVGYPTELVYNGTNFILAAPAHISGSFTATLTGCTTSPTATVYYTIVGGICTLWIGSTLAATSNTTAMTITGLPTAVQPSSRRRTHCLVTNNAANALAFVEVNTGSGTATFNLATTNGGPSSINVAYGASSFANSGSKGLDSSWTVSYPL